MSARRLFWPSLVAVAALLVWLLGSRGPVDAVPPDLLALNAQVHRSLRYQSDAAAPLLVGRSDDVRAAGEGHCGNYAYLLANELAARGHEAVVWLASSVDGLVIHTLVEVDGRYTLDPTLGVAYPHRFLDLWSTPSLGDAHTGEIKPEFVLYGGSQFFSLINSVTARARRGSGHGVALQQRAKMVVEQGEFYSGTERFLSDGSTANLAGAAPGAVELRYSWDAPVALSYLAIIPNWDSFTLPTRIRLTARLGDRVVRSGEEPLVQEYGTLGVRFSDKEWVDSLELAFDEFSGRQHRLIAREIALYGFLH